MVPYLQLERRCLSNHFFDLYLKEKHSRLSNLTLFADGLEGSENQVVAHRAKAAIGTALALELGNERSDVANPDFLEEVSKSLAETHGLGFSSIVGTELVDKGYDLLYAVGQGAKVSTTFNYD